MDDLTPDSTKKASSPGEPTRCWPRRARMWAFLLMASWGCLALTQWYVHQQDIDSKLEHFQVEQWLVRRQTLESRIHQTVRAMITEPNPASAPAMLWDRLNQHYWEATEHIMSANQWCNQRKIPPALVDICQYHSSQKNRPVPKLSADVTFESSIFPGFRLLKNLIKEKDHQSTVTTSLQLRQLYSALQASPLKTQWCGRQEMATGEKIQQLLREQNRSHLFFWGYVLIGVCLSILVIRPGIQTGKNSSDTTEPSFGNPKGLTLFNKIPAPLAVMNSHGTLLWMNPAMALLLRIPLSTSSSGVEGETNADRLTQLISHEHLDALINPVLKKKTSSQIDVTVTTNDDAPRTIRLFATPLDSHQWAWVHQQVCHDTSSPEVHSTSTLHILLSGHDDSDHAQYQHHINMLVDELQRHDKGLQDFAAVTSHDLQEPLRKLMVFSDRLKHQHRDHLDEQAIMDLDRVNQSAHRMKFLIDDLLKYSQVNSHGKPFAPVSFIQCVQQALDSLQSEFSAKQAHLTNHLDEAANVTLMADRDQLVTLLHELLENSLKFAHPDRPLHITLYARLVLMANDSDHYPVPGGFNQEQIPDHSGNGIELHIVDNGIGVDEPFRKQVFDVFQRLHSYTQYEGTGIGLALSRKIAQRHGGTLTLKESPDGGCEFILTLPATA